MILPGLGIFTNIGSAHEEGFPGMKEKIAEKLKLFAGVNFLLYCRDHDLLAQEIEQQVPAENRISWSKSRGGLQRILEKPGYQLTNCGHEK